MDQQFADFILQDDDPMLEDSVPSTVDDIGILDDVGLLEDDEVLDERMSEPLEEDELLPAMVHVGPSRHQPGLSKRRKDFTEEDHTLVRKSAQKFQEDEPVDGE